MTGGRRGLIGGSLVSLAVRALDLPFRYGFHLLIAAQLGVVLAGQFYIVFSAMVALAGLGRLGIDRALTRQIAASRATDADAGATPAIIRGTMLIAVASAAVSALLAGAAGPAARHLLDKPELAVPLALGALAILPQNLGAAAAGALAGLQRIGPSQMVYSWLWPALFCLMSLVFGITFPAVLVLIAASFLLAAAIGWGILARILASLPPGPARAPAPLLRPGLSLFTQELIQLLIASAPAIILGMVADNRQVGLFALAWRIALLINVVVAAVAGMAAPKFAELFALSDRAGLRRASAQAIALALAVAALPLAVMLIAPTPLLAMFGSAFGQGATTLRILALGQLAAAACTALPELLGMTAHLSSLRRINALALVVLLVATPPLASLFGAEGAAAATALTIAVNGGAAAWAVHRHLAIWPWQWPMARRRPGVTP